MIRLSDLMENDTYCFKRYGMVVFGVLAQNYWTGTKKNANLLEGLSPKRILLNDEWFSEKIQAIVEPTHGPHTAYAYYPPEYLEGKKWTPSCSVFALCAIIYKLLTGMLPYVGNVPESLLSTREGLKYIQEKRKEDLDLSCIPPECRRLIEKGLSLKKRDRYKSIGDTADDYAELAEAYNPNGLEGKHLDSEETIGYSNSDISKLLSQNNSEFLLEVHKADAGGLDDLVGLDEIKKYLLNVLAILKNPEKAKRYRLTIPNGILLYGPPGCGKTSIAQKFAAECRMNYAILNAQDIACTYVHGTQRIVKQLFDQAVEHAPIVLILDEVETMVPNRNHPDNVKVAEDTNAFLSELNDCGSKGVYVVGTTNRPEVMDSAILRSGRFDKKIYVPLPDEQTRTEIFRMYLKDRPIEAHIDYQQLGRLTSSGYISSDIRQICDEVAGRAFNDDALITQALVEEVIREGGPSVNRKELRNYEESRKNLEPSSHNAYNTYHIGFR